MARSVSPDAVRAASAAAPRKLRRLALWALVALAAGAAPATAGSAPPKDECNHFLRRICCGDENLILVSGCAPRQAVPLMLGLMTDGAEIFVDGERLDGLPKEIELRADIDHTVFVKRDGYLPELIVLRSQGEAGSERLEPSSIDLKMTRRVSGPRAVEIQEVSEPGTASNERADKRADKQVDTQVGTPEPPARQVDPPASQAEPPANQSD